MYRLFPIILVLVVSCNRHENEFNGIWMGAYYGLWEDDAIRPNQPLLQLMEITNDSISIKTFNYPQRYSRDTLATYSYEYFENALHFNGEILKFYSFNKDSIVFFADPDHKGALVLKKVPDITSPDFNLRNEFYEISTTEPQDSFDVFNANTIIYQNEKWAHDGLKSSWYVSTYKGLKFLVFSSKGLMPNERPPMLITGATNELIEFKTFDIKIHDGTIRKIEIENEHFDINGTWIQNNSLRQFYTLFPYLGTENNFNSSDSIAKISFNNDSVFIKQYNRSGQFAYWRSSLGNHMLLTMPDSMSKYNQWYLEMLSDDTLQIFNGPPGWWGSGSDELILSKVNSR